MAKEVARYQAQLPLFVTVYRRFGGLYVASGTGLDFDEAQHVFVPADQIEFAAAARTAVIAGNDHISLAAEVAVCEILATTAECTIRIPTPGTGAVAQPIGENQKSLQHKWS